MKHIESYILLLLAVLFTACAQDAADNVVATDDETMSVNIGMVVPTWADVETRAGVTSSDVGIAAGSMQMLCFDKNGYYLGMGEQIVITPATTLTGGIKAEVPASTCRVHFIANADLTEQSDWIGMYENTLMTSLTAAVGDKMVYWGYVSKSTPALMKAFLESGSNTVYMLRDVAKVSVKYNTSGNGLVSSASVVMFNDADKGTLAPFNNKDLSNPFSYTADEGADGSFVPLDAGIRTATEDDLAAEQFIFESNNNASQQLFAIVKVVGPTGSARDTKYHKVEFYDKDNQQLYTIKRNHHYEINVADYNTYDVGYDTFQEAVNGEASNNRYITLTDKIPSITMGDYTLTINGETSVIYNETGQQTITFTTDGDSTITEEDFSVSWKSADKGLTTVGELQMSYDKDTRTGNISFPIDSVTTDLRKGVLVLNDSKHRIRRYINVYSTTPFEFGANLSTSGGGGEYCLRNAKLGTTSGNNVVKRGSNAKYATALFYYYVNGEPVTNLTDKDITVNVVSSSLKYKVTSWKLSAASIQESTKGRYSISFYFNSNRTGNYHADSEVSVTVNGLTITYTVCNTGASSASTFHSTTNLVLEDTKTDEGNTMLNFNIPENYPTDMLPVTVKIATNDFNPIEPTLDVVVEETQSVTGKDWNFWYEYSATTTGQHSIKLNKSRTSSTGNELWLSADYFTPQKIEFSY